MIDFRYHLVSIVAVFLALALGLFIGSTSLRPTVAHDLKKRTDAVSSQNTALRSQLSDARDQLDHADAFDNALEPYAVAGRLAGRSVVLVSAPNADDSLRSALSDVLTSAGATVTGDVRLQDGILDPQQDQFLRSLTARLNPAAPPARARSGSERALDLLAKVLGAGRHRAAMSPAADGRVLSGFETAKLVNVEGDPPRPATLAVLVGAAPPDQVTEADTQRQTLLAEFARRLSQSTAATVVAGPSSATGNGGLLDVIRGDSGLRSAVSTVDGLEFPRGVIATVLALAARVNGHVGSYGAGSGADAPVPSYSP